ncbi:hypothetical protein ACLMJK_007271 [Lecanora helva]
MSASLTTTGQSVPLQQAIPSISLLPVEGCQAPKSSNQASHLRKAGLSSNENCQKPAPTESSNARASPQNLGLLDKSCAQNLTGKDNPAAPGSRHKGLARHPFGSTKPPYAVWEAFRKVREGIDTERDRDLVEAFSVKSGFDAEGAGSGAGLGGMETRKRNEVRKPCKKIKPHIWSWMKDS